MAGSVAAVAKSGTGECGTHRLGGGATAEDNALTKTLYFTPNTAALGTELWRVDAAGNVTLVKDITPGPANTSFGEMIAFNGELYFDVLNGSHFDLWKVGADGNAVLVTGPDGGVMQGVQNP